MRRRDFILALGGAAAAVRPLVARAQQPRSVTIGILNHENPEPLRTLLRNSLRDIGYIEGENLRVEFRSAEGRDDVDVYDANRHGDGAQHDTGTAPSVAFSMANARSRLGRARPDIMLRPYLCCIARPWLRPPPSRT